MASKLFDVKYKFNEEIKIRDCGEVMLAFNPESSDMLEFNNTGAYLFNMFRKEVPFKQIYDSVCDVFEVEYEDIDEDINELVNRMIELNCIIIQ